MNKNFIYLIVFLIFVLIVLISLSGKKYCFERSSINGVLENELAFNNKALERVVEDYLKESDEISTKYYYCEINQKNDTILFTIMHAYQVKDIFSSGMIGSIKFNDKIIFFKSHFFRYVNFGCYISNEMKELAEIMNTLPKKRYLGNVWQVRIPIYDNTIFVIKDIKQIMDPPLKDVIRFVPPILIPQGDSLLR